ncbi:hypothetical protein Goshw_018188 [Gossypium schwendimanii]|uniref:Uncharacterized protein n=1 Tax=Gossypium schwendimanii TaxID=34291 RepID=A0A7J9MIV4_GOSSC|nr:hypothetical protein [Gossypium schwendimanii]
MAVLSDVSVEAARVIREDLGNVNHMETYSSVYHKARSTMSYWLQRLASGPSPQGPDSLQILVGRTKKLYDTNVNDEKHESLIEFPFVGMIVHFHVSLG